MLETMLSFFVFFFFKQKTAYEMCGRDWSSDVCSSDLWEAEVVAVTWEEDVIAVTWEAEVMGVKLLEVKAIRVANESMMIITLVSIGGIGSL